MLSTKFNTRCTVKKVTQVGKSVRITFSTGRLPNGEKEWKNSIWNGVVFSKKAQELLERFNASDTKTRPVIFIKPGDFSLTCEPYVKKGLNGEPDTTVYPVQVQIFEFSYSREDEVKSDLEDEFGD